MSEIVHENPVSFFAFFDITERWGDCPYSFVSILSTIKLYKFGISVGYAESVPESPGILDFSAKIV